VLTGMGLVADLCWTLVLAFSGYNHAQMAGKLAYFRLLAPNKGLLAFHKSNDLSFECQYFLLEKLILLKATLFGLIFKVRILNNL